jgi:hypothetical protein
MKDEIRYIPIPTQYERDQETLNSLIEKLKILFVPEEPEEIIELDKE